MDPVHALAANRPARRAPSKDEIDAFYDANALDWMLTLRLWSRRLRVLLQERRTKARRSTFASLARQG